MEKITIEFWVVFQMLIDLILVFMVLYLLRNMKSVIQRQATNKTTGHAINLIEPLLNEAKSVVSGFDKQFKKKKHMMNTLNEELDSRIISLNRLLNRADACRSVDTNTISGENTNSYDQQEIIFDLYKKGNTAETIARMISIPKGEVDLVIGLKKKFE